MTEGVSKPRIVAASGHSLWELDLNSEGSPVK